MYLFKALRAAFAGQAQPRAGQWVFRLLREVQFCLFGWSVGWLVWL